MSALCRALAGASTSRGRRGGDTGHAGGAGAAGRRRRASSASSTGSPSRRRRPGRRAARRRAPALAERAGDRRYAPCWAAMAAWDEPLGDRAPTGTASRARLPGMWAARESAKPGREPGERWTVQAGFGWSPGASTTTPQQVAVDLVAALGVALSRGAVPPPSLLAAHRWLYARAVAPLAGRVSHDAAAGIGAGGDWCAPAAEPGDPVALQHRPGVPEALHSGRALARALAALKAATPRNPPDPSIPSVDAPADRPRRPRTARRSRAPRERRCRDERRPGHVRRADCPTYTDIFGNRARNNIQESLRDLGKDTPTRTASPVSPGERGPPTQPACTPLDDWQFPLGTGYNRARRRPVGLLSIVTARSTARRSRRRARRPSSTTQARTPAARSAAVTVTLTARPGASRAQGNSALDPGRHETDPLMNTLFPGAVRLRRPALRDRQPQRRQRRVDLLPAGRQARLLLRYYVKPPPTQRHDHRPQGAHGGHPGRHGEHDVPVHREHLVQRRRVVRAHRQAGRARVGTFYRAAGQPPWSFREIVPAGWRSPR